MAQCTAWHSRSLLSDAAKQHNDSHAKKLEGRVRSPTSAKSDETVCCSTSSGVWRALSSQPQEDVLCRAAPYEKTCASSQNPGASQSMSTRVMKHERCSRQPATPHARSSEKPGEQPPPLR